MKRPAGVHALLVLAAWAPASCGGRPAAVEPVPCAPTAGQLPEGGRADGLAGEYRLTLVATRGARAGKSASGRLVLRPFEGTARPVQPVGATRYPLYGGATLALDSIGAVAPGDISRADAARPGVLVMEWRRATPPPPSDQITLRFGADANAGGPDRFDGTHLALHLAATSATRFAGIWDSGGGEVLQAGGYFCAERVG
jgi:hypothetical protein